MGMGRYLICNARRETGQNAANSISKFQVLLSSGFCLAFWEKISVPIMLLIAISGFVIYRYRETRALTLAQFFEMRYSRSFRLFMGVLAAVAGLLLRRGRKCAISTIMRCRFFWRRSLSSIPGLSVMRSAAAAKR
jgi:hypothetical protein